MSGSGLAGRIGVALAVVGAGVLVVAAFLPADRTGGSIEADAALLSGGWAWIVGAVLIAVSAVRVFNGHRTEWPLPVALCVLSSLSIVVSGADTAVMTQFGTALYAAAAGVLVALIGALTLASSARRARGRQQLSECPNCTRSTTEKVCQHCGFAVRRYRTD